MLKHKKFLSLLMVLPFFIATSCSKPKNPHPVEKVEAIAITNKEVIPSSLKDGEKLPVDQFVVTYNDQTLTWLGEKMKDYERENTFFVTTNAAYPTSAIVTNPKVTTNVEKSNINFYVAHYENSKVFVSSTKYTVTVTNSKAIKPWVWFVVTGVVIFGVVAMVFFTRRYKAKKEGKI